MSAVVTDSTCQLTAEQAARSGIAVVPRLVRIEDAEFAAGVDLAVEAFYGRLTPGVSVATASPAPGAFVECDRSLVARGAPEIVSVHLSDGASGTLDSARLAARSVDVPVHLVDSRMTSYGLGVVALALADLVRRTGSISGVDALTESLVPRIGTVFILKDLRYVLRGGRMRQPELPSGSDDIPILGGVGGGYELIGTGRTISELVEAMSAFLLAGDQRRHVAIALAAPDTLEFTERLEDRMRGSDKVESLHRYRMGPSIAVHTGPGTAGGFWWPSETV